MGVEVYANGNAIACKAGSAKVTAAFPDVCNSPPSPPAGPIPVPYPCSSFSSDMKDGSKDVKIGGKEVMLKNQSYFATSPLGDEAATKTFGGSLVTHTITGETFFAAWSMDVKCEGQNVPRHMDITTSNHACDPGSTPPFPDLEKLNPAKYEVGKCPCCGSTECPSALKPGDKPLTFEEYYNTKGNPKRAEQFAYWKEVKTHICSCVPPNEVFPKEPCNVFRAKDDDRYKEIVKKWNPDKYRKWYETAHGIKLKTALELLAIPADRAGAMSRAHTISKNTSNPAEKKLKDEYDKYHETAKKKERINHKVPKDGGGCPDDPGNLQPQQTLCDYCQSIDQIMTDEWQA